MIEIQVIMDSDSIHGLVKIECDVNGDEWLPIPSTVDWHALALKTLSHVKWDRRCVISVLFTNDAHVHELNLTYRHKDKPTNVLSFPAYDDDLLRILPLSEEIPLGDIVFAFETIQHEALTQNKPFNHHLMHLFVHGLLHLLGYDHETDDEATQMERLEIEILNHFSIPNPYEVNE